MKRHIFNQLKAWANSPHRKPLLLRGARQVGKTYVVEQLGQQAFSSFVSINLEKQPELQQCFDTMKPAETIQSLQALININIIPGETLLFIDEIQAYPKAIAALRYFKEDMPALHVIAAGSLLEFALQREKISMPVGRVDYCYMQPCSFIEFLSAVQGDKMVEFLQSYQLTQTIPDAIHCKLLELFRLYMAVGGMPEAVAAFVEHKDFQLVKTIQRSIWETYRDDFGKYATSAEQKYIQIVYDKLPGSLGQQVTFSKIDADHKSRDLKQAMSLLEYAGILKRIFASSASGLPLSSTLNEKKFKLMGLDVGLMQARKPLPLSLITGTDFSSLDKGALAEQVVAQELLAYQHYQMPRELYFWARDKRGAQSEVDYVINIAEDILPIEVKAGSVGRMKSLQIFLEEKALHKGIVVSSEKVAVYDQFIKLPVYLLSQLERLLQREVVYK